VDVKREPPKKTKRNILIAIGVVAVAVTTVSLNKLEARPPSVQRGEVIIDSVRRGELVRQVRAPGTLVSENMRFVAAVTAGRVERRPLRPGSPVTKETVILELSNPDEQLQYLDAQRSVTQVEQDLVTLRTNLESSRLTQEAAIAQLKTQHATALRSAALSDSLAPKGYASANDAKAARELATELAARLDIEQRRLTLMTNASAEQLQKAEANLDRQRAVMRFRQDRLASLNVRAGLDGVLQTLNLEDGQWVNPGQELARVAQPGRFKAVLRVPDAQAKDVVVGQLVDVDTRPAIIKGRVMRVDPISTGGTVTVDVELMGEMPQAARADLAVDGTIEIDRLTNVMYVGRPAYGQPENTVGIFKLEPDGRTAVRTNVKLGRASVNQIEVVQGLAPGDKVIISDMTNFDNATKVRIN
jgi:RND family efflux transporter MFP subunit